MAIGFPRAVCTPLSETTRAWVTTSSILVQEEGNLESSVALPRHLMKLSSLLLLILLVAGPAAAGTLRVGTVGDYPPFNYIDDAGELTGFDVDIARALCDEMEVECNFIQEKWAELIISLRAGKFDAIAASMSITERRKRVVSFTDHYYSNVSQLRDKQGLQLPSRNESGRQDHRRLCATPSLPTGLRRYVGRRGDHQAL